MPSAATFDVNGYGSASDSYQTRLGLVNGNLANVSGSGTSSESGSTDCSYSGSGTFSSSSASTGSDGSYQSCWLNSTASEHGYQDNSQSRSQGWTINDGQWASGTINGSSSGSGESYFNFAANGGSTNIDPAGDTTTVGFTEQVTSDTYSKSGSTTNGNGTTSWASSSGNGTANYNDTWNYCPYGGGDPASAYSSVDNWSQPSYTSQNTVSGEAWAASSSGSSAPLPQNPTSTYGPTSQASPGFSPYAYYPGFNLGGDGYPPAVVIPGVGMVTVGTSTCPPRRPLTGGIIRVVLGMFTIDSRGPVVLTAVPGQPPVDGSIPPLAPTPSGDNGVPFPFPDDFGPPPGSGPPPDS